MISCRQIASSTQPTGSQSSFPSAHLYNPSRSVLDARATGVELPPECEPEPTKESNLWATTCARNCLATSASNRRSRFLVRVVASPDFVVRVQPHKPAEQQVVIHLFDQQTLAAHRV